MSSGAILYNQGGTVTGTIVSNGGFDYLSSGGIASGTVLLSGGTALVSIAVSFIGSAEFTARYGSTISDTQFVTQLYQNVLGRAQSSTDLNNNLAVLANGTSRAQLLVNFSESQEPINDTASAVQAGLYVVSS